MNVGSAEAAKITLEAITPLFLGGADPAGLPEMRAASVRGLLRFWWRALAGGALGSANLRALHKAETDVFGSTDSASPIVVRVTGTGAPQRFRSTRPGVNYLLWSVVRTGRQCLPPGTRLDLTLHLRTGVQAATPLLRALRSLWLLTQLGGLGARSRRAAGSLQVVAMTGTPADGLPPFPVKARTPAELQRHLAEGLNVLRALTTAELVDAASPSLPDFDVLHPKCFEVIVLDRVWRTWEDALDAIGSHFQQFRSRRPPDYGNVKAVIAKNTSVLASVQRAAFGLPIVFYYRSLGGQKDTLEGRDHDRRSSPLSIRCVRLANGEYTILLTLFRAAVLEQARSEKLKLKNAAVTAAAPDLRLIDTFLSGISAVAPVLKVSFL